MKKTKLKIMLFIFLSVIGIVIGVFFAGYINLLLSGGNIDNIAALRPAALMASLTADERHRLLTLCVCFVIVAGIAALLLISRRETFESDMAVVAGAIQTPVAIGQGQHGTARWLKPVERKRAFSLYRLGTEDPVFAALLEAGARDRKEVRYHNEKIAGTDLTAPGDETAAAAAAYEGE
jgi:type IV secretion system protein VirD4